MVGMKIHKGMVVEGKIVGVKRDLNTVVGFGWRLRLILSMRWLPKPSISLLKLIRRSL